VGGAPSHEVRLGFTHVAQHLEQKVFSLLRVGGRKREFIKGCSSRPTKE